MYHEPNPMLGPLTNVFSLSHQEFLSLKLRMIIKFLKVKNSGSEGFWNLFVIRHYYYEARIQIHLCLIINLLLFLLYSWPLWRLKMGHISFLTTDLPFSPFLQYPGNLCIAQVECPYTIISLKKNDL